MATKKVTKKKTTSRICKKKILKHIEEMIDANYDEIEAGNDGDNACQQEISTLDNLKYFITSGMYNV